jgi:hypothetical protein
MEAEEVKMILGNSKMLLMQLTFTIHIGGALI